MRFCETNRIGFCLIFDGTITAVAGWDDGANFSNPVRLE
jgi:hypothetical protein